MDDQVKSRKRSRRRGRVGNVSNLSMRLNPDFNIKDAVNRSNIHVRGDYNENIEELDPKTMDFDTLADMLHPSFIYDYLIKTLHFLQSDVMDLYFPNIAPYKEEFLVKIVQKPGRLRSKIFNDKCEAVATEIRQVLEENQRVFQWFHSYDYYPAMNKIVLVYKKLYFGKSQNEDNKNQLDTATPSAVSLASSLEDLSITSERQENDPLFKTYILNITMKFIKDVTQLDLKYPELLISQAQYVYSLLYHQLSHEAVDSTVGFGFKSVNAPLHEAIKEARKSFEFEVSFIETRNLQTAQILLRKKPKKDGIQNDLNQKDSVDTNQSLPKYSLPTLSRHTSEREDSLEQTKRLVVSVSPHWVTDSLNRIAKFVEDPQRASLEMNMLTKKQASFLELVPVMSVDREYHQFFDYECGDLLTRIGRPRGFKLDVFFGNQGIKMKSKNKILFEKVPDFPEIKPAEIKRTISPVKTESCQQYDSKDRKTKSPAENESRWRSMSKERKTVNSAENESSNQRSVTKEPKSRTYTITFQSAGSEVKDAEPAPKVRGEVKEVPKWTQYGRVGKLLAAMSTPLESDRAERMMRMMGWDGGALGVRGDGITEPLMPVLHLAPGAGLGHVNQKKQPLPPAPTIAAPEFRTSLLNDMLSFLRSSDKDTVVLFPHPLDKKQNRFIKPTVKAFNNRSNVGLSTPEEIALVNAISEEMRKDLSLQIACQLSADKKELYLAKAKGDPAAIKLTKNIKKKNKSNTEITPTVAPLTNPETKETVPPEELLSLHTRLSLEASHLSAKRAKKLAYKLLFLEKIKDFITNQNGDAEYKFDIIINSKQKCYVQKVVNDINKKGAIAMKFNKLENDLLKEIKEIAGDCYVTVVFFAKSFTLQKKYYQKRFINSALELPPPKSTDVKNTIIYVNNVPMSLDTYNDSKDNNSADDKIENNCLSDNEDLVDTDLESIDLSDDDSILDLLEQDKVVNEKIEASFEKNVNSLEETYGKLEVSSEKHVNSSKETNGILEVSSEKHVNSSKETNRILEVSSEKHVNSSKETNGILEMSSEKHANCPKETNGKLAATSEKHENDPKEISEKPEVNNNSFIFDDMIDSVDIGLDIINIEKAIANGLNLHKRSLSSSDLNLNSKKYKQMEKYVKITSQNNKDITIKLVKQVQTMISENISDCNSENLPCLECYGIKNGGLIYSCQNEKSFEWLQKVLSVATDVIEFSTIDYEHEYTVHKIILKVNSFIPLNYKKLFDLLEKYNFGLNTMDWVVLNEKIDEDCVVLTVNVDENSLNFIRSNSFSLNAGVDKIRFSICWD